MFDNATSFVRIDGEVVGNWGKTRCYINGRLQKGICSTPYLSDEFCKITVSMTTREFRSLLAKGLHPKCRVIKRVSVRKMYSIYGYTVGVMGTWGIVTVDFFSSGKDAVVTLAIRADKGDMRIHVLKGKAHLTISKAEVELLTRPRGVSND